MYRFILASCLFGAVLALPESANAQISGAGCQSLFKNATDIAEKADDKVATPRVVGRTMRGSEGSPVEIRCGDIFLIADEIDHLFTENRFIARGHVVFTQTGTRISAEHGEFDRITKTGFFLEASGTLQLTDKEIDRSLFGGQEAEATFVAKRIEKIGPKKYKLTDAVFTACVQPSRRWEITSSSMTFTVDKYAIMHNAVMRVKDVPLAYLPIFYYPIHQDGRATGFLMPSYGSSTFRGFTLSNAFFWAMSRNMDATLYHDWFTSTGQGYGADYRYIGGPSSQGDAKFYVINEKGKFSDDGTQLTPARRSYEIRGNIAQSLPGRFRLQAQADYFTDVTTQQLYQVDLASFSRRSRYFRAEMSGNFGRVRLWAQGERNDIMYGAESIASIRYLPRTSVSISEAPLFGTKLRFSASMDTTNAVRFDDVSNAATRVGVFRTDGSANLQISQSLGQAFSVNAQVSARRTDWNTTRDPVTGALVDAPLVRRMISTKLTFRGPTFTRVFNTPGSGYAERFKHVIQPSVTVQRTSAFDRFSRVIQFDGVDTVLGGMTQVSYGVSNSLLARVRKSDGTPEVRTILNLDLSQTYYSNKLAAQYDQQYQSSFSNLYSYTPPPSNFSPVSARVNFTPTPELGGQFGLEYDTQFRAVRSYSAGLNTSRSAFDFVGSWTKRQVIPGLIGYDNPDLADHFVNVAARIRKPGGGSSFGYSTTYDVLRERLLQQRFTGFYNSQCCGIAVDYSVTNLSHYGIRDNKLFSISITLAGIGSFMNPLGMFGNNGIQR